MTPAMCAVHLINEIDWMPESWGCPLTTGNACEINTWDIQIISLQGEDI